MSRDSNFSYLHLHASHHADLLEDYTNSTKNTLHPEAIDIPPHLQPVNPEDEDDVVPDQHAAFGIQRATQSKKEVAWRDLGLEELVRRGPGGVGSGGDGLMFWGRNGGVEGGERRDEPVRLALRRRPGAGSAGIGMGSGAQESAVGGGAGNGLPR